MWFISNHVCEGIWIYTISEEDLLIDVTKTEIEKRLSQSEKERALLQEKMSSMEKQMKKILELTNELYEKVG